VRLYGVGISGLGQNLEEFVVGEEVKARESAALDLQVILHLFLNFFELLVVLLEFAQQLLRGAAVVDQRSLEGFDHDIFPELVHHNEFLVFLWQLFLDVLSAEDVLQVHPLPLASQPLVDYLRNQQQSLLYYLHALPNLSDIARAHHRLDFQLVVVEGLHDLFNAADDELVLGLAVVVDDEVESAPFLLNFLHLRLNLALTSGPCRYFLNRLLPVHYSEREQFGQAH